MTKKEMEIKILELEKEILELKFKIQAQTIIYIPQVIPCQPVYPYPNPWYEPQITWGNTCQITESHVQ